MVEYTYDETKKNPQLSFLMLFADDIPYLLDRCTRVPAREVRSGGEIGRMEVFVAGGGRCVLP